MAEFTVKMPLFKVTDPKEIDDVTDQWHATRDISGPLHWYLGWTREEYTAWLRHPDYWSRRKLGPLRCTLCGAFMRRPKDGERLGVACPKCNPQGLRQW